MCSRKVLFHQLLFRDERENKPTCEYGWKNVIFRKMNPFGTFEQLNEKSEDVFSRGMHEMQITARLIGK